MDKELNQHVMIERVEMIARLTAEGTCQERDREIALDLIAEIAKGNLMKSESFSVIFSQAPAPIKERFKCTSEVRVNLTLDRDQPIAQETVSALQRVLTRRVQSVFPFTRVTVEKGSMTGVELMGFDNESDREVLDRILQEVWEDESWR